MSCAALLEFLVDRRRGPELGVRGIDRTGRHHTHHREGGAVECDRPLEDARIGPELPPPEPVAQHECLRASRPELFGSECSAEGGLDAKNLEERSCNGCSAELLRVTLAGQIDGLRSEECDAFERLEATLRLPVFECGLRDAAQIPGPA